MRQYGVEEFRDAGWAICVPSVANIWPRRWFPPAPGANRKPGAPNYTGDFSGGFGNRMTVRAVWNPVEVDAEPRELHRRAPGYGVVEFDRATRQITFANWPRWVDVTRPGARPYAGWPITIHQLDNGMPRRDTLGTLRSPGIANPVVEVIEEAGGTSLYTVRVAGTSIAPGVPRPGEYTVRWFNPVSGQERRVTGLAAR